MVMEPGIYMCLLQERRGGHVTKIQRGERGSTEEARAEVGPFITVESFNFVWEGGIHELLILLISFYVR